MDAHWTQGYVSEITYPHAYIAELNPLRLQLPFLAAGLAVPQIRTACDLGFGQGLSVNIHAAASGVQWHGNDFIAEQAANACRLAAESGADLHLTDESFADFFARDDLPDFDFIGMHGVWSWVSADNRALIVDFIRRKLRVGGVVYVGYNTQPGWAATVPLRELMSYYVQHIAPQDQPLPNRIQGALAFVEQLLSTDPAFARANPSIAPLVASLREQDPHYLAHEYFNSTWQPMSFAEMEQMLAPAKLGYACSAHHDLDRLNLSAQQQALLRGITDPVLRESARDFCMNQQFRKDYWVKGARRLNAVEHAAALRALKVVLLTPPVGIAHAVLTPQGEIGLDQALYGPLLGALADHMPKTLGQLEQALAGTSFGMAGIVEAMSLLCANGDAAVAQDDAMVAAVKLQVDRLNMHLLARSLESSEISHLACPLPGGAVALNRLEQMFLCAWLAAPGSADSLAPQVWDVLKPQGKRLLHDGQPLLGDAANLAELGRLAQEFVAKHLPLLRTLRLYPELASA